MQLPAQNVGRFDRSAHPGLATAELDMIEWGWNMALIRALILELAAFGLTYEQVLQMQRSNIGPPKPIIPAYATAIGALRALVARAPFEKLHRIEYQYAMEIVAQADGYWLQEETSVTAVPT